MYRLNRSILAIAIVAAAASTAQSQQRPPIRQLGSVTAKSAETFTNVASVRPLSDGSLLVNDVPSRRVVLFDSQLSKFTIVADSTSATGNAYGGQMGSLVAFRGDSSIFIDPSTVSMLVIDPSGKIARVAAIPRATDAGFIGGGLGGATFDNAGRLIYRASARPQFQNRVVTGGAPGALPPIPDIPDSAFIVRIDLATRKIDTLGAIRTPKIKLETKTDERGTTISSLLNPLPVVDDWAVTPDGAIAIVRGRDYHVDWLNPDGTRLSSPKIPFDWQRMTDEDKVAFIDSVKAARERQGANAPTPSIGAASGSGGMPQMQVFIGSGPPGGGPRGPGDVRVNSGPAAQLNFIPASELPDYKPPFFAGSVRADTEGNLWVRTIPTSAIPGGPVYDVINRKGELVDRVQIPVGRSILGFGPNGTVFLGNRDGTTLTIERATVR